MIRFRDFIPPQEQLGLLGKPSLTTLDAAVEAANNWVDTFGIDVFNVETLVLPGVRKDEDTIEAEFKATEYWYQLIRVWYREEVKDHLSEQINVFDTD